MNLSVAKKSVTRLCDRLKSRRKTLPEVCGRAENEEEETSATKVEKE
jgi:hypothetical protein